MEPNTPLNSSPDFDQIPSPSEPTPSNQNSSPNRLVLLLVVISLILLASTVFLTIQNYQLKKQISVIGNPSPSPLVASTPDPTADWKTFAGSTYSFKYPTVATVEGADRYDQLRLFGPTQREGTEITDGIAVNFSMLKVATSDLKTYIENKIKNDSTLGQVLSPLTSTTVAGLSGFTYKQQGLGGAPTYYYLQSTDDKYVVEITDFTADPANLGYAETVSQILSTFKFTSAPSLTESAQSTTYPKPASWRTVNIPDAGVSVCLPPQWKVDPRSSTQIVFDRDPAYMPNVGMISSYPYKGGSRREEYLAIKLQYEPDPKPTAQVSELTINGQSVLRVLINSFSEAYVMAKGDKLYEVTAQEPSYVNSSRVLFNQDFYTMLGCLKPL